MVCIGAYLHEKPSSEAVSCGKQTPADHEWMER
jgi:hypothetical protein